MAGTTIWKGSIHFGDTDVPVKQHAAVKEEGEGPADLVAALEEIMRAVKKSR